MKNKIYTVALFTLILSANVFAQMMLPRESNRAEVAQFVGDTKVSIVYHRPNIKGRKVWGDAPSAAAAGEGTLDDARARAQDAPLVPYGRVWRTGANENTIFEINNDVKINGQMLPAGKYGLHTIPGKNEWTIIFNKVNNAWGSFTYDAKQDALRVTAKPQMTADFQETMLLDVENIKANTAEVVIRWEKMRVPFTVDVGDINARVVENIRKQMTMLKPDDAVTPVSAANYIFGQKMTANYAEAITWLDMSLKAKETANALALKASLQSETGNKTGAIKNLERAISVAKAANPNANTATLEKRLADWKAGK